MRTSSIIIFGVFSAILLIFSCIILKAPRLYSEFEFKTSSHIALKHTLVLRDRN